MGGAMGPRVLVVEDERDVRQPLAELLAGVGFDVETATNGLEALRSARALPPDVIVLDLMMPVMNGWEFLTVKRSDPRLADIPVVVMSASGHAAGMGAASHVEKPFDVEVLLHTLARLAGAPPASARPE